MQRFAKIRSGLWPVVCTLVVLACASTALAQPEAAIIIVSSTDSLPGGAPEMVVRLDAQGPQPVSMVLFFAYPVASLDPDDDYYETVLRNGSGTVIRDADGNATTRRGALMPSAGVVNAGKAIEVQVYSNGVLGVAITGLNQTAIPDGELFRMGFKVASNAPANAGLNFQGLTAEDGVTVPNPSTGANEAAFSSAAYLDGSIEASLPLFFTPGGIDLSCGSRSAGASGVDASTGDTDSVTVTWDAIGPGNRYRVYRANSNNLAAALPLGEGWSTATSFVDFSAIAAVQTQTRGCFPMTIDQETKHYYWLLAMDASGCESAYSGPVEGFRGGAKSTATAQEAGFAGDYLIFLLALALLPAGLRRARTAR
ncbi:MAG: hypothetical protein GC168_19130 [Candidatus Hydrogenedens sp.]|nr:hypothetical protein [Candidatus Hydrogenedens sp.]